MTRAAFLIRLRYGEDREAEFQWRWDFFNAKVLPRILAQTVKADIWLWMHPRHHGRIGGGIVSTFTAGSEGGALEARHPWRTVVGLPRYEVQLRLDSDDLVSEDYVEVTLGALDGMRARRALVHHQPYKVDIRTGTTYWCAPGSGRGHYSARKISAFCALRQNVGDADYEWVYSVGHTKLYRIADESKLMPEGRCWATCHALNDSTEIYPWDRRTGHITI